MENNNNNLSRHQQTPEAPKPNIAPDKPGASPLNQTTLEERNFSLWSGPAIRG